MAKVSVRYIVEDVDETIAFYERLGFQTQMRPGSGFAMLTRGDLHLLVNTPGGGGGAGEAMPDGSVPQPGGWNRFMIEVDDLDALVGELATQGVRFRNEIITGRGGRQILAEDPSGNLVELFEPAKAEQPAAACETAGRG